jgi:cytidylate kinase
MGRGKRKLSSVRDDPLRGVAKRVGKEREHFMRTMDSSLATLKAINVTGRGDRAGPQLSDEATKLRRTLPRDFRGAIAIGGRVGSGKYFLADQLADTLGWKHASFGRYVRGKAVAQERPLQLPELQALGVELIEGEGWDAFVRNAVDFAGVRIGEEPFIIDGVRHVAALETLRKLLNKGRVILIYLDADDESRHARLAAEGVAAEVVPRIDKHDTEEDVRDGDLIQRADHVVRGDLRSAFAQTVAALVKIAPALRT